MLVKEKITKVVLLVGDMVCMYVALFLAIMIRAGQWNIFARKDFPTYLYYFIFLYLLWVVILFALDFYNPHFFQKTKVLLIGVVAFFFGALFIGVFYFYFRPDITFTPKTILLLNVVIFAVLAVLWRRFFAHYVIKNYQDRIIFLGLSEKEQELLLKANLSAYSVVGNISLADIGSAKMLIEKGDIDAIIFSDSLYYTTEFTKEVLGDIYVGVRFFSFLDFYERTQHRIPLSQVNELWFLENMSRNETHLYHISKRVFDLVFASLFFVATLLLFPFITIAIMLDSKGAVFYQQPRVGKRGKVFVITRFRTMQANNNQNTLWRERSPSEITRVGAFLRRFHLDELPQSLAILKGELSFVGPRPEWKPIADMFEKEIPFYRHRYMVNPGFTGWAQINFPPSNSVAEAKEKFAYDLYYIKNRSLWLDIEIMLKTVRLILRKKM